MSDAERSAELAQDDKLTPSDVADIQSRLQRMDERSSAGPWTQRTLKLIGEHPGVVSTVIAKQMGMERFFFKAQVRKLKRLGLTESLEVGYRLSPRGRAYRKKRTRR